MIIEKNSIGLQNVSHYSDSSGFLSEVLIVFLAIFAGAVSGGVVMKMGYSSPTVSFVGIFSAILTIFLCFLFYDLSNKKWCKEEISNDDLIKLKALISSNFNLSSSIKSKIGLLETNQDLIDLCKEVNFDIRQKLKKSLLEIQY